MRVIDLIPGSIFDGHTFIAQTAHPLYPNLQLVIWKMSDGSWSFDALSIGQEIHGEYNLRKSLDKQDNLRRALGV